MDVMIEGLNKRYLPRHYALRDVHLRIQGDRFGLIGPNGAGKSTLLRILATRIRASSGSIKIAAYDLSKRKDRQKVRVRLGYVPQELDLPPHLTGREFLDYIALLKGLYEPFLRRREVSLQLTQLHLQEYSEQKIGSYSTGLKRRLQIAQALLAQPDLLIIDELTRDLDAGERLHLHQILAQLPQHPTIIFSTHHLADIQFFCQQYAHLEHGQITNGPPRLPS